MKMIFSIWINLVLAMMLSPVFLTGDINDDYSELFCQYFSEEHYDECEIVLDDWERYYNPGPGQITALKALSLICKGETVYGEYLLNEALNSIPKEFLSESNKSIIRKIVDETPSLSSTAKSLSYSDIMPCKNKQPKAYPSKGECMNECLGPNPSGGLQIILCMTLCSLAGAK